MKLRVAFSKSILALTTVALATTSFVLPQSAPAATTDRPFSPFGMSSHPMWARFTTAQIDAEMDAMAAAGTKWLRFDVGWASIEYYRKGQFETGELNRLSYIINQAKAHGIEPQPAVMCTPSWANGSAGVWVPPTNDQDLADFMYKLASTYKDSVTYWEIWNEPNLPEFFKPSVNAARYVKMLKAGYEGTKRGNPAALVISGGLSCNDKTYLQQMYNAGAQGSFDLLGMHPYAENRSPYYQAAADTREWNYDGIADLRTVMDNNGDAGKNMWASEAGWTTADVSWGVSEAQQAQYTKEAFERILRDFPYIEAVMIYNTRDMGTNKASANDNYGLLRQDWTKKPAYYAFAEAAKAFQVPVQPSITVAPGASTVTYGQSTALTVRVAPAAATTVNIERRTSTGLWENVASATTAADGTAHIAVTPRVTTVYRAVAPDEGLTSALITVKVRAKATVKTSRLSIRRNRSVRFGGKILPGIRTSRVVLQRKVSRRWVTVRKIATNLRGAFSARLRARKRGRFIYRIKYYGNSSHLGTYSRPTPLRVY